MKEERARGGPSGRSPEAKKPKRWKRSAYYMYNTPFSAAWIPDSSFFDIKNLSPKSMIVMSLLFLILICFCDYLILTER
jgi:hypothetical protein